MLKSYEIFFAVLNNEPHLFMAHRSGQTSSFSPFIVVLYRYTNTDEEISKCLLTNDYSRLSSVESYVFAVEKLSWLIKLGGISRKIIESHALFRQQTTVKS